MYLNSFYVQKSKLMLYPLLGFEFDSIKPVNTYVITDVAPELKYLIVCAYKREYEGPYYEFRKDRIYKHRLFREQFQDLEYDYMVFHMDPFKNDFELFLKGEYSKFSKETKAKIISYYSNTRIGPVLIDTHLNPENYHDFYAEHFKTDVQNLVDVHETLSPPDLEKETKFRYKK